MKLKVKNNISYTLKKSKRAKRLRLTVSCDGQVVVTIPMVVEQSVVDKFISDKRQWVWGKLQLFKNMEKKATRTFSRKDYLKNKDKTFILASERVEFYNKTYNFSFSSIRIKNQKTRWGSCSSKQNLNLNYKIIFLPAKLRDYIIVHELCHLREFNHSKSFWTLVEKTFPDYLEIKRELRKQEIFYR
ncbi:MAG: hypothetical protein COU71_02065 [Parcubacteria group bacterium CG10_big_fil_rev_8_21_14_0_10_38_31]|nr:MAG: hypothetical protein COU71_02065 [Parcubacteria group bacterium CG10_big_fil_rev_8_21_14_0_10_38_31]